MPTGDEVSAALADALGESCSRDRVRPEPGLFVYANGLAAAKMLDGESLSHLAARAMAPDRCLSGIRVTRRRRQALGVD